jgi:hypothetical protein
MVGDFNLPGVDWQMGTARHREREVLEATEEKMMEQPVTFSTHTKGNILDLLLTTVPERVTEVREEGRLGKSGHSMIVFEVSMNSQGTDRTGLKQTGTRRGKFCLKQDGRRNYEV